VDVELLHDPLAVGHGGLHADAGGYPRPTTFSISATASARAFAACSTSSGVVRREGEKRRAPPSAAAAASPKPTQAGPRQRDGHGHDLRLRDREHNAKLRAVSENACPLGPDDGLAKHRSHAEEN